jgi:hypothetical protein
VICRTEPPVKEGGPTGAWDIAGPRTHFRSVDCPTEEPDLEDPRDYPPLIKKNQNIAPAITKTIRRVNRKNASMESIGKETSKRSGGLGGGFPQRVSNLCGPPGPM